MGKKNKKNKNRYENSIQNTRAGFGANGMFNGQNKEPFFSSFNKADFLKGAVIGAIGAYLLTNKSAQESIFKLVGKGGDFLSAGVEELKERYEDMKAQMQQEA